MSRKSSLVAAAGFLVAAAMPAHAQVLLDFRQVILCKALREDAARLQCFDRALSNAPSERTDLTNVVEVDSDWQITESRSPADNSARVAAVLQAAEGTAGLVMRCYDKTTDVYVSLRTYVGGIEPLPVSYRFDDGATTESRWMPSREGGAIFLGTQTLAIAFARTLPDDATLYLKARDFQNRTTDLTFKLGPVSDIRSKIATACQWPDQSPPPATQASAAPIVTGPIKIVKHHHVQAHQQRWNINVQR
jgi:hypothetical protein